MFTNRIYRVCSQTVGREVNNAVSQFRYQTASYRGRSAKKCG